MRRRVGGVDGREDPRARVVRSDEPEGRDLARTDRPPRADEATNRRGRARGGGGDEAHRAHGAAPAEVFAVPGVDVVVELGPLRGVVVVAHPPAPPRPDVRATRPGRGARVRVRRGRALRAVLGEHEGAARGRRAARGGDALPRRERGGVDIARGGRVRDGARGGAPVGYSTFRVANPHESQKPSSRGTRGGCGKHRVSGKVRRERFFEWAGSLEKVKLKLMSRAPLHRHTSTVY